MKVLIASGGSGGHIFPAVSLARELLKSGAEIIFVASRRRLDRNILEREPYKKIFLSVNPMPYRFGLRALLFTFKLALDTLASFGILVKYRPEAVIGFGGYTSGALVLLGSAMNAKTVIHEQNVIPGRTNRLLDRIAGKVALSFPETGKYFSNRNIIITGNPLREESLKEAHPGALGGFKLDTERMTILVMGGSQGASSLNRLVCESTALLPEAKKERLQIIHIAGAKKTDQIQKRYDEEGIRARVYAFIPNINEAYSTSDIVISRSGAAAVFELAAFKKPMILIPYPEEKNNQRFNAIYFAEKNAAIYRDEKNLRPEELRDIITDLIDNPERRRELSENAGKLSVVDGAQKLARLVWGQIDGDRSLHITRPNNETCPHTSVMTKPVPIARKIHMIGIGGIGMSALSHILAETRYSVSGSDIEENNIVKKLRGKGIAVDIGHDASRVNGRDLVVFSSSIPADNPELLQARKNRTKVIPRTELLKMVMEKYKQVIGVTGTHGKTTITAMAAYLLEEAGFDPTVLIGGESPHFAGNAKLGKSGTLVAEVDESDGRLVTLTGLTHIIIPNLEREHLEHYRDEAHLINTFRDFLGRQTKKGILFCNFDDDNLKKIKGAYGGKVTGFGFSEAADIRLSALQKGILKVDFDCSLRQKKIGRFTINIPGIHNAVNAAAVISLGLELGIGADTIKRALAGYRAVKRRFEIIGTLNGARVVEDYAHHPTEVKATISAAYSLKPKRLITIFQPHRYTRTKSFYKEFASAFSGSDEVILTDVYSASEEKIEGASSKRIYDIMARDKMLPVKLVETGKIGEYLQRNTKKGDLVLVMGAGDIGKVIRGIGLSGYQEGNSLSGNEARFFENKRESVI